VQGLWIEGVEQETELSSYLYNVAEAAQLSLTAQLILTVRRIAEAKNVFYYGFINNKCLACELFNIIKSTR
jgi:hypothetical protein